MTPDRANRMMLDMPTTFPNVDSIPPGTYTCVASGWTVRILDHDVTLPFGVRGTVQMDVAVTFDSVEILATRPLPMVGTPDFADLYESQQAALYDVKITAPPSDMVTVGIPRDLLPDVASALYHQADLYRSDKAHAPDGIIVLERDADRLDELAAKIEAM